MAKLKLKLISYWRRAKAAILRLPAEDFLKDFSVRVMSLVGLIMLFVVWIYSMLSFPPADYLVPLRYNSFLGVTALGSWYQLYLVPSILLFLYILNILLAHTAYKKDKMVAYILLGTNIFLIACGAAVVANLSQVIAR